MGSTLAITGSSLLMDLLNSNTILAIFIALFVVFFLLGLLLGINIGARNRSTKNEKSTVIPDDIKTLRQTNTLVQDNRENTERQIYSPNHRHTHSPGRRHKHNSVSTL